jgi:DNA polymerase-3 subunit delta
VTVMEALVRLQEGKHDPVYTLLGSDSAVLNYFVSGVVQAAPGGGVALRHDVYFDEGGVEEALYTAFSPSLFGDHTVVFLRRVPLVSASGKGKWDSTALEDFAEHPSTCATVILQVDAEKLDERKKLTKLLKKYPILACNGESVEDRLSMAKLIQPELFQTFTGVAQVELAKRCTSVTALLNEAEKLRTLTAGAAVDDVVVRDAVVDLPEDGIFDFVQRVLRGEVGRALSTRLDLLQSGTDDMVLLAMLARHFRLMWHAKQSGAGKEQAKSLGVHPYALKRAAENASAWSSGLIERALVLCADTEFRVKSGRWQGEYALEWLIACLGTLNRSTPRRNRAQ